MHTGGVWPPFCFPTISWVGNGSPVAHLPDLTRCVSIYKYIDIYIYIHIYIHIYIYIYACVYTCIYRYIYIYR